MTGWCIDLEMSCLKWAGFAANVVADFSPLGASPPHPSGLKPEATVGMHSAPTVVADFSALGASPPHPGGRKPEATGRMHLGRAFSLPRLCPCRTLAGAHFMP